MKRFLMSWVWACSLTTPSAVLALIRLAPKLCLEGSGGARTVRKAHRLKVVDADYKPLCDPENNMPGS